MTDNDVGNNRGNSPNYVYDDGTDFLRILNKNNAKNERDRDKISFLVRNSVLAENGGDTMTLAGHHNGCHQTNYIEF